MVACVRIINIFSSEMAKLKCIIIHANGVDMGRGIEISFFLEGGCRHGGFIVMIRSPFKNADFTSIC